MCDIGESMSTLPLDGIAADLSVSASEAHEVVGSRLPALPAGVQATAADLPGGLFGCGRR